MTTNSLERPKGCFWDANDPLKVTLNTADTVDKDFDPTTEIGICGVKQGKLCLNISFYSKFKKKYKYFIASC